MLSHWSWLDLSQNTPHAKVIFTVCVFIVAFFLLVKPKERAMLFAPVKSEHWSAIVSVAVVLIGFIGFTSIMGWDLNPPMTKTLQKVVIVENLANKGDADNDASDGDEDDSSNDGDDTDVSDGEDDASNDTIASSGGNCANYNSSNKLHMCPIQDNKCAIVLCKNKPQAKCVKAKADGSTFYEDECEHDGVNGNELFATFKKIEGKSHPTWIVKPIGHNNQGDSDIGSTKSTNGSRTNSISDATDQVSVSDDDSN